MNLSEMRTKLRRKIGNPTTTDVPNSELNDFLNDAQEYISDRYNFHMGRTLYAFNTVAGTKRYALPADAVAVIKVGNRTDRKWIRKLDNRDQFRAENQDTDVTGPPERYSRMRDWIQFWPIPDAVYSIGLFYKNAMASLVNDNDESPLPVTWHNGIVLYARYLFYDERQDYAKAQYGYAAWSLWASSKPSELEEEQILDDDLGSELPALRNGNPDGNPRLNKFEYGD